MSDALLVGRETSDDAGVIRVREDLALIQTVDFFTPIADDPASFGRIAAANALSDVYAMGGRPLAAMNLVAFPRKTLSLDVLEEILAGGLEKIHEAGALLVGGHSIEDDELKYGLSVTGVIHPDDVVRNSGARPGDRLVLTKPVGTGIVATAVKAELCPPEAEAEAVRWMTTLNAGASRAMQDVGVSACTDVTGFGLMGHALEVAVASRVTLEIRASDVPLIAGVLELAAQGMVPGGTHRNRSHGERSVSVEQGVDSPLVDCLFDAQTSGGLLIAVSPERTGRLHDELERRGVAHHEVGRVVEPSDVGIRVRR
jgi:selenide,water dikinase